MTRRSKNRRNERRNVLEVKARSQRPWWVRCYAFLLCCAGPVAAVLVFLFAWQGGGWLLNKILFENATFALQQIDVKTDGVIPAEQILLWANLKEGQNTLKLDLTEIKRDLKLVPWIDAVRIERTLPHTLRLRVTARVPIAQIKVQYVKRPIVVYLLDKEGQVMLPLREYIDASAARATPAGLPVISGVKVRDLRPGHRAKSSELLRALQLIQAFEQSELASVDRLRLISLNSPSTLKVITEQGSQIIFSLARLSLDLQLDNWRVIREEGLARGCHVETLDLSLTNNIPVRFRPPRRFAEDRISMNSVITPAD